MKKAEVMMLLAEIQDNYSNFDASDESIERHYKYLKDFNYQEALKNVQLHVKTNDFPPRISHIRGHLGDQKQSEISKKLAQEYEDKLNKWSQSSDGPSPDYFTNLRNMLR